MARPVSISTLTAVSVSASARWRSSSRVVSSSERIISFTAASRMAGLGLASANRDSVLRSTRRSRLLVPTLVSWAVGTEPAAANVSGSTRSYDERLSSTDVAMTRV